MVQLLCPVVGADRPFSTCAHVFFGAAGKQLVTRIADAAGGVSDEVWAHARKHYDDEQLAALVSLIALINACNRMNVIIQNPAGDHEPGQWG
jgi:hypothetical protein